MDELLGIEPIVFSDDQEENHEIILTPLETEAELQRRSAIRKQFSEIMSKAVKSKGITGDPSSPSNSQAILDEVKDISGEPVGVIPESGLSDDLVKIEDEDIEDDVSYWNSSVKDDIRTIPIWIQVHNLDLKYWGRSLYKIVRQIGKPIREDTATKNRDRLQFARVMVEVNVSQAFPSTISFVNEKTEVIRLDVVYEWKPTCCSVCKGMGHEDTNCRKNQQNMTQVTAVWRPKNISQEGFQVVHAARKFVNKKEPIVNIGNAFGVLGDATEELRDVKYSGTFYTWNNKQCGDERVYAELDRVLSNLEWNSLYPTAEVVFWLEGIFYHSPTLLSVYPDIKGGKNPFRYFDMWSTAPRYQEIISNSWAKEVSGTPMFQVVQKLKFLKGRLKDLNKNHFGDIHAKVLIAMHHMHEVQKALQQDPLNVSKMEEELNACAQYRKCQDIYRAFLHQKAKVAWIKEGDGNTKFFHQCLKQRRVHNTVYFIKDMHGNWVDSKEGVNEAFLSFYKNLLGSQNCFRNKVLQYVLGMGPIITQEQHHFLLQEYSPEAVKRAIFSIPNQKAPGPDGYGSGFYKTNWDIIGVDVSKVVLSFLHLGQMLKEVNNTSITLIPKTNCPANVSDFRPISCCNVLYKAATKLICERLRTILPNLIAQNEGGFIHGRFIAHNIMICQDIVRHYRKKSVKPSCMIKLDLKKAYDIAKRGLSQGDPLSPLLFVICMEYLSRFLAKTACKPDFQFHYRCKELNLNHLYFADDVILFCRGDYKSIVLLLQGFKRFSVTSGLQANVNKSAIYCHGMKDDEVRRILLVSGFIKSQLPFRYLGVLICPKRIGSDECSVLVDRMVHRIRIWSTRHLSFAGRLTLINVVLVAIHLYWAQIMILPKAVLDRINDICRNFLWHGSADFSGPGLVSWTNICKSKTEGGLGLRNIVYWNYAAIGKHVWHISMNKENLWVKWVHSVYIQNQDWWEYTAPIDCSWYWRQIVKIKEKIKGVINRLKFENNYYSIADIYKALVDNSHSRFAYNDLWNRLSVPKHRIFIWLYLLRRLKTKDRLREHGMNIDPCCSICGVKVETHNHLFFGCFFSDRCVQILLGWLEIRTRFCTVEGIFKWIKRCKLSRFKKFVYWSILSSLIYHIWRVRNIAVWEDIVWSVHFMIKKIKWSVYNRILYTVPIGVNGKEWVWFHKVFDCI
ncbi:uncharacterized protein LOC133832388 [Humulus lupulus]|uniref:uncharacterized protein LOC133832388 n=1 Tax=Humulus lupulus TaxID=3486 RepID=UPI002B407993|nr:uncharacterized protein LOC133832388 [Humulus lupulus]